MKREITLMMYTEDYNDTVVKDIKDFCSLENIPFKNVGFRGARIYDFIIEGDTSDYLKLKDKFKDNLRETYYAEFGNVFDLDKESFAKWQEVLSAYYRKSLSRHNLLHGFCELIKDETDVRKLEHLTRYPLEDAAADILNDRIADLKGEKSSWERHMYDCVEIDKMVGLLEEVKEGKYTLKENDINSLIDILQKSIGNI